MNPNHLKQRAQLISGVRAFFHARDILEVTTPCVVPHPVSDVHIDSVGLKTTPASFLRTSPEPAHKWLLAHGLGDIYEMGPVFRAGERGRHHQPEFTLLEWYRIGWSWRALADEVSALITEIASMWNHQWPTRWLSWSEACIESLGGVLTADQLGQWQHRVPAEARHWPVEDQIDHVFASHVQSQWAEGQIHIIYDYPSHQKALAELSDDGHHAKRFEVFVGPVELANGYQELTDVDEQRQRFVDDLAHRQQRQRPHTDPDERLLAALAQGLPRCAGVALGVDRLVMVVLGLDQIAEGYTLTPDHPMTPST